MTLMKNDDAFLPPRWMDKDGKRVDGGKGDCHIVF